MNTEQLCTLFSENLGRSISSLKLTPLHSHASYRSYYRATLGDGSSYVVMEIPPGKWSLSEEVTDAKLPIEELPFLEIARYLHDKGFPVPQVIAASEEKGVILLEDLGDQILCQAIKNQPLETKLHLYQQAIHLLVDLQNKTNPKRDRCIAFQRRFDTKLLCWEFDHFLEYGIERRLARSIAPSDRRVFEQAAQTIAEALTQLPQVFVHRDYQSHNLMIRNHSVWLIDFQDALLGPITYDLAALLRDSYFQLDRRLKELLLDEFLQRSEQQYNKHLGRDFFSKMFDWTTIQRKLKDAGRFVFIDQEKGNPNYLPYIPLSLAYVKEALARQAELKEFYDRLKKYIPEWQ